MENCVCKNKKIYSGIGGQAVLDGIMMKNGKEYSVACRIPDKSIRVEKFNYDSLLDKCPIFKWPFIRGTFTLIDSLIIGMKTLSLSAEWIPDEESTEPESKFEIWLTKTFGDKLMNVIMGIASVIAIVFAVAVFMVFPAWIGSLIKMLLTNIIGSGDYEMTASIFEGVLRIILFILYIKLISKMEDIKKTFMYHGSEHKCINCIEDGLDLTVENVMKSSKEHKRCGTSFIVFVMIISVVIFMFIKVDNIWLKFASRILLVPVIAGISYEFLRFMGKYDNKLTDILSKPGLAMQGLTTLEPTSDMVEVAIKAVEEVFDWHKFKNENFSK